MTLRQFNLVMFALGVLESIVWRRDWYGAVGWSVATIMQLDIVLNELEDKRRQNSYTQNPPASN